MGYASYSSPPEDFCNNWSKKNVKEISYSQLKSLYQDLQSLAKENKWFRFSNPTISMLLDEEGDSICIAYEDFHHQYFDKAYEQVEKIYPGVTGYRKIEEVKIVMTKWIFQSIFLELGSKYFSSPDPLCIKFFDIKGNHPDWNIYYTKIRDPFEEYFLNDNLGL